MGLDCSSRVVVGVLVPDRLALEPDRSERLECRCGKSWPTDSGPKFCPFCGSKPRPREQPPLTPYEQWRAGLAFSERDSVGLFNVDQFEEYDAASPATALGVELLKTRSNRSGERKPVSCDAEHLVCNVDAVRALAMRLGIAGRVRVYLTTIMSY